MTIFTPCPYTNCKARAQTTVSDTIDKDLQTTKEKAMAEVRKRVAGLLKHDHREGRHKRGR